MAEQNRTLTPDDAREIDYVLQRIRFGFVTVVVVCWLVALLMYFLALQGLVTAAVMATVIPANLMLVWTFGFRAMRDSLSPFMDRTTGKLDIPGGRKRLPIADGFRIVFWDKRETRVMTVGIWGSVALAALYLLLGSPRL